MSEQHRTISGSRATIDMGRGTSDRQVSKKYICYLHEWDRRLKKTVNTPRENSLGHPAEINGIRVTRKGKGAPPADAQEQLWATRGKREVPGRSRATNPNLLTTAPLSAEEQRMLTADEHRGHFTRRITNRFNESSLSGAGAVPTEGNHIEHRPFKGHGVNNPGWGLSDNMTKIMSHSAQPDEPSLRASRSLVWAAAPRPNTADSIIRHRYDDPKTVAEPAKLGERTLTPASRAVNLEESRSCFMSSLNEYAANKVRGHYGDHLRRSTNSLASLAGY
ncbi:hypothetical protein OEZ85_008686 [Tetradesmus obliquus]|uniref:DUF4005 domain-containing protein n=1 Tax=Tetradesmus obliquus TaxID=3088 RepID=A0ABY8TLM1_TETOB|nr:hypothetical protein OEZ85_008686 [Tetradesmus obliquus]